MSILRSLRAQWPFSLAVISILAVGIGATTAVFSVVDRVLFRPLPYAAAERLTSIGLRIAWLEYDFLTAGTYLDFRRNPGPFAEVTSWSGVSECDQTGERPARLRCARVEASFLPVLGVTPAAGRNFTAEEDRPGAPRVALISQALSKSITVGQRIEMDGQPTLIVGVLPASFQLPTLDRADLLLPQALPPNPPPGARPLRIYGRLRAGATPAQARQAILARSQELFKEIPPHMRRQVQFHVLGLREVQMGQYRPASWALLAAVLATLWTACLNAANLLLARSIARRRDVAVRVALGATRGRLTADALAEGLALGAAGGIAGCALAFGLLRLFIAIAPAGIPPLAAATLDLRVLAFGMLAALACGAAFGLAPAFYTPQLDALRGSRTVGRVGLLARRALVGAQIAVSLVLVTCAGVFLQSLWNRQSVWLGMKTDGVVAAEVVLGPRYGPPAARAAFYDRLEQRLAALPGVESAALSDSLPPGGTPHSQPIFAPFVEGRPPFPEGTPGIVIWRAVTPAYFRTLGIPILRGRAFTEDDRRPSERSIILSAAYARVLFGDADPLGKRLCRFPVTNPNQAVWYTIVGVAADARNGGLSDRNDPEYYLVRRHATEFADIPMASAIVARGGPSVAAMLRREIAALDPALPADVRSFDDHLGELAAYSRLQAWVLTLFASIGVLLAGFGLYGLVAFLVAQRKREFGVRIALGATARDIAFLVLGDALYWTGGGVLCGLAGAIVATRALRGLLFHVSPGSPTAYLCAAAVMTIAAGAAAFVPSLRAARVDPAATLKDE